MTDRSIDHSQASLRQFIRGEQLDGDNAYYCEQCDAKRTTLKRTCIRRLPRTLVIQLKRFEHDYDMERAYKLNHRFEVISGLGLFELRLIKGLKITKQQICLQFPMQLDMSDYMAETLRERDLDLSHYSVSHSTSTAAPPPNDPDASNDATQHSLHEYSVRYKLILFRYSKSGSGIFSFSGPKKNKNSFFIPTL